MTGMQFSFVASARSHPPEHVYYRNLLGRYWREVVEILAELKELKAVGEHEWGLDGGRDEAGNLLRWLYQDINDFEAPVPRLIRRLDTALKNYDQQMTVTARCEARELERRKV